MSLDAFEYVDQITKAIESVRSALSPIETLADTSSPHVFPGMQQACHEIQHCLDRIRSAADSAEATFADLPFKAPYDLHARRGTPGWYREVKSAR